MVELDKVGVFSGGVKVSVTVDEGTVTVTGSLVLLDVSVSRESVDVSAGGVKVSVSVSEGTVTVTGSSMLDDAVLEDSLLEPGGTVTNAVEDGTVSVTGPILPDAELEASELAVVVMLVLVLLELVSLGTAPRTSTTVSLSKHPTCVPTVLVFGMAAHTLLSSSQPVTSQVPVSLQMAYWPLTHASDPAVQDEVLLRLVNSSFSAFALPKFSVYWASVIWEALVGDGVAREPVAD